MIANPSATDVAGLNFVYCGALELAAVMATDPEDRIPSGVRRRLLIQFESEAAAYPR